MRTKPFFQDANTTEIEPNTSSPLVIDMPEHHPGDMGGTMRLGKRTTVFKENQNSLIRKYTNEIKARAFITRILIDLNLILFIQKNSMEIQSK